MRERVFIRFDHADESVDWLILNESGAMVTNGHGPLAEVAASTLGKRIIVLVPGEDVLLCRANVPGQKKRLLAQAVPFALEEQLAEDVDELHFAIGRPEGNVVNTAVVSHAAMSTWLSRLHDAGIQAHALIPETLVLPWQENQWRLACLNNKCLLRTSAQGGMAMDSANVVTLLELELAEVAEESEPERLQILVEGGEPPILDNENLTSKGIDIQHHKLVVPLLQWLAEGYDEHNVINLLQGRYSRRERIGQMWRPWYVAASLATVWLVLQFLVSAIDYFSLSDQRQALAQDLETIYRQAFPDARKVVNPKVQMERALKALRGGGAESGGFTELLALAGEHINGTANLELQRVNYKDGLLDVSLLIGDLQQLDQLKQQLSENGRLQVEIQSATSRGQQVDARLRIKGQG